MPKLDFYQGPTHADVVEGPKSIRITLSFPFPVASMAAGEAARGQLQAKAAEEASRMFDALHAIDINE
jgi:hypothetical protein